MSGPATATHGLGRGRGDALRRPPARPTLEELKERKAAQPPAAASAPATS